MRSTSSSKTITSSAIVEEFLLLTEYNLGKYLTFHPKSVNYDPDPPLPLDRGRPLLVSITQHGNTFSFMVTSKVYDFCHDRFSYMQETLILAIAKLFNITTLILRLRLLPPQGREAPFWYSINQQRFQCSCFLPYDNFEAKYGFCLFLRFRMSKI